MDKIFDVDGAPPFHKQLFFSGILAIPVTPPPNVAPVGKYDHWRKSAPSESDLDAIWRTREHMGVAIMCEGVEAVDLDTKNQGDMDIVAGFEAALNGMDATILPRLYVESTKSGGRHYVYKVESKTASSTLARRPSDKPGREFETLVDYLAHNKLLFVAPTPGYSVLRGSLLDLPVLTNDERRTVILAAMSLNTYVKHPSVPHHGAAGDAKDRPGDDYNSRVSVEEMCGLLQSHGWRVLGARGPWVYLNRPGARNPTGVDATINAEHRYFYCWTTSERFPASDAISFFATFAHLETGGDFKEAAKRVAAMGYGRQYERGHVEQLTPAKPTATGFDDDLSFLDSEEQPEDPVLTELNKAEMTLETEVSNDFWLYNQGVGIAGPGMVVVVSGPSKSYKTQVVAAITASAYGHSNLHFDFRLPVGKKIYFFDTEQGDLYAKTTLARINRMAGYDGVNIEDLRFFRMRDKTVQERRRLIIGAVEKMGSEIGAIVIDGALDILEDYNDVKESNMVSQLLLQITERGIMLVVVIHESDNARGTGSKPIGHLGSFLVRKCDCHIQCRPVVKDDHGTPVDVKNPLGRGRTFKTFTIINEDEIPTLLESGGQKTIPPPAKVFQTRNVTGERADSDDPPF